MTRSAGYSAYAQYLQSAASIRSIEFKDGAFYCDDEEVTGRKYIVDFRNLRFGRVTRDESRTITVREGRALWDYSPDDLKSVSANDAAAHGVSDGTGDVSAEHALILSLEDYENGALVRLVLHGPDDRASIGRLCNLYDRHPGNGDAIVKLNIAKQKGADGIPIKVPELSVVDWRCHRWSDRDDDIPF